MIMPHTLHPMVMDSMLWHHTLLILPLHHDAFMKVLQIMHLLSPCNRIWNRVQYKKQYPKEGSAKGQGSVRESDVTWIAWRMSCKKLMQVRECSSVVAVQESWFLVYKVLVFFMYSRVNLNLASL